MEESKVMDKGIAKIFAYSAGALIGVTAFLWLTSAIFLGISNLTVTDARPWTAAHYLLVYGDSNKLVADNLITAHFLPVMSISILLMLIFAPKKKELFGNAVWAKMGDIKKAGLVQLKGLVLARFMHKTLAMGENLHTLLAAPTRGGKGVAIVIPVCLSYQDSLVVLDIKGENFNITSGFRAKYGQKVYLFNPMAGDFKTSRWNPLSYISESKIHRVNDIQKISMFLIPTPKSSDPMWSGQARKLFDGLTMMLLDLSHLTVTLGEVWRQLNTKKETGDYLKDMMKEFGDELDQICISNLNSFIHMPSKTRQGVVSTLNSALNVYSNPIVDAATDGNDFDLRKLRREKMTIYVKILPGDLDNAGPILNLFFQQLIDLNTRELPEQDETIKHRCGLLMDEFTSIGRLPVLERGIAFIAGYGLQLMPIIQSPSQLGEIYGRDVTKTMLKNFHIKLLYRPIDMEDATLIANELGNTTEKVINKSTNSKDPFHSNRNHSQAKRQLLLPQEVKELPDDKVIILHWKCKPIMAKRFIYYKDKEFKNRLLQPVNIEPMKIGVSDVNNSEMLFGDNEIVLSDMNIDVPDGLLTDEQAYKLAVEFFGLIKV